MLLIGAPMGTLGIVLTQNSNLTLMLVGILLTLIGFLTFLIGWVQLLLNSGSGFIKAIKWLKKDPKELYPPAKQPWEK